MMSNKLFYEAEDVQQNQFDEAQGAKVVAFSDGPSGITGKVTIKEVGNTEVLDGVINFNKVRTGGLKDLSKLEKIKKLVHELSID